MKKRTPLKLILIIGGIILITQLSTFLFSPKPEKDAWGKIILARTDTKLQSGIKVVGETQDIATGFYIWLVIQPPGKRFCIPVKRVLRNTRFGTSFQAPDLKFPFDLSIYVVDASYHENWQALKGELIKIQTACPPANRKLASIRLKP